MVLSGCRINSSLTKMINYKLKAAPTAVSKEGNSQKGPKANRILIGVDAHLKSYQAAHKIDNGRWEWRRHLGAKKPYCFTPRSSESWPRKWWCSTKRGPWDQSCIG